MVLGMLVGIGFLVARFALGQPLIEARFGLRIGLGLPTLREWSLLAAVLATGLLVGPIPAWRAYRLALSSGLAVRF